MAEEGGMRNVLVYVAGPIGGGGGDDLVGNVSRAQAAGLALVRAGLSAHVPHSCTFWGNKLRVYNLYLGPPERYEYGTAFVPETEFEGAGYEDWLAVDLTVLARCDVLLRLDGESAGADREAAHARACGIPVFATVEQVIQYAKGKVR